ncbi:uncharacterized protein LOC120358809 [Solenopsis invicta]|uniref:uncharacterized protein LOC120358809 n=1 Tax=Solenopsis invicta TaxID=13686 RepID=UPI00193E63F9|nr:uncharacterized protein LOC120358809 [Solenopsis invicta]
MGVAPCFRYASLRPNMFGRAYCYRTSIFFIINCYFILIAMSAINSAEWYALVKYKSDNTTEIVPLCKIKVKVGKGLRIPFKPKSLTDFDKTAFYAVNTARGSNDGKEHKWYALIGLLADSREALEHTMNVKRISWPNMY